MFNEPLGLWGLLDNHQSAKNGLLGFVKKIANFYSMTFGRICLGILRECTFVRLFKSKKQNKKLQETFIQKEFLENSRNHLATSISENS